MPRDTDLYADSCHRVATTHIIGSTASAAGVDGLIEELAAQLTAARWTKTDNGVSGGHPFYKFVSQQSQWWDDENNPPAGYVGKVKVHLFATVNTAMQIQAMTADDAIQQSTADNRTAFSINFADGFQVRIIACPYQFAQFYRTDSADFHSMLVSALHTPRFLQERRELKETLLASRNAFRLRLGSGTNTVFFSVVKDKVGTTTNDSIDARAWGPSIVAPYAGSGAFALGRGLKVVNAKDDPTFADPTLWFPLGSPPMVAWGNVVHGLNVVQDINKLRGWLWDAIVLSESYPLGYTVTMPDGTIWEAYTDPGLLNQTLFIRSL